MSVIKTMSQWKLLGLVTLLTILQSGECAEVIFEDVPTDITDNVFLYLVQGPAWNNSVKFQLKYGLEFGSYDFFDPQRQTVFYFHGWGESVNQESVQTVAEAFLQLGTFNIVLLDYSVLVKADNDLQYLNSFFNASDIGNAVGQYLQQYIPAIQLIDLIHLVGHSLGSQIMSKTARTFGPGKLPWLTGLDPAGPVFNIPTVDHLDKTDAKFVDVIHTDGGFYGDYRSVGTVNFFPNGGVRSQPYCEKYAYKFCSHHMSWRYYAMSLLHPQAFPAKKCDRILTCDLSRVLCDCDDYNNQYINMGLTVDKNATGDFFLDTSADPPYGEGMAGIDFKTRSISSFPFVKM